MSHRILALALPATGGLSAADWSQVPELPHQLVAEWAQLPDGWNLGETPAVAVDSQGSIYVVEIKTWRIQKFARP